MTTTPVVDRVPIPHEALETIRGELRALCQRIATQIVEADRDHNGGEDDAAEQQITTTVTVAEAIACEAQQIQHLLWDEAQRRGVPNAAVARARGVTQQAQSGLMARRSQQR